jgi:hypothetical protein
VERGKRESRERAEREQRETEREIKNIGKTRKGVNDNED